MTRIELQAIFEKNQVSTNRYSFRGAGGGDVWALERVGETFELSYYDERGSRRNVTPYNTENDGCLALLAKVSDMLRGLEHRDILID